MATFTGTNDDEVITPDTVSPTVTVTPPGGPDRPSDEEDRIIARGGADTAAGGGGDDVAFLGAGNDLFIWAPGDGSDRVGGGEGFDTHLFLGSGAGEEIFIADDGSRIALLRNLGNITMDLRSFERIEVRAFGGNDAIIASGLALDNVALLLDGGAGDDTIVGGTGDDTIVGRDGDDLTLGGRGDDLAFLGDGDDVFGWAPGDGSDTVDGKAGSDTHVFFGSDGDEVFSLSDDGARVELLRDVGNIDMDLRNFERIELRGFGGGDSIDAGGLTNPVALLLDGGAGDDTIVGSAGADTIVARDGDDSVIGGRGDDLVLLGAGNDVFVWNPGDGSDIADGRAGSDTHLFNGSDGNEVMSIADDGPRVELLRDLGNIDMNLRNFERIELRALGGNDSIDASGLTNPVDLLLDGGAGNDTIIGSAGADTFVVAGADPTDGTAAQDRIEGYDQTQGDEIDLVGVTVASSAVVGSDLVLTLDTADEDQVRLVGVADINDVIFV